MNHLSTYNNYPCSFVKNEWATIGKSALDLFDPVTGEPRGHAVCADYQTIRTAVDVSKVAFKSWKSSTPSERASALLKIADHLEREIGLFASEESLSTGKPFNQAQDEVRASADVFRFYAGAIRTLEAPSGNFITAHTSFVIHEPIGAWAVILPWNYPLLMLAWRVAPLIATGNTVIIKPAPTTPDTASSFAIMAKAYLPEGVVQTIIGGDVEGEVLTKLNVDGIAFTGSTQTGLKIRALRPEIPMSMELGGNGAVVVMPDAPTDTADVIFNAMTYNAGQSCASPTRVIVVGQNKYFVDRLTALVEKSNATDFGPLNSKEQLNRATRLLETDAHERIVRGYAPETGNYFPAVLVFVKSNYVAVVRDEVFAPLLTIQFVADIDEAIKTANSVSQALGNSVHSNNISVALHIANQIAGGECWINTHLVQSPELPHSGRKSSGTGIDLSTDAMNEFMRPKTITIRNTYG